MKIFKKVLLVLLVLIALLFITGNKHIFKGLYDTYLQGRTSPAVDDSDLFYSRVLESKTPKAWAVAKNYNQQKLSEAIQKTNVELKTRAFLVIQNDSLVLEEYFGNYNKNTLSNSFSMAKTFLSIITGAALKEGKIKLNDPVCKYLPEYISPKDSALKIEHLLNMTSGMNFDESYGNPFGFMARAYYGTNLKSIMKGYHLDKKPGSEWEYLGGNNLLMSFILEKALGKKVSEYAQEKIWQPLGMESDAKWMLDHENGDEKTFSGLYATARDFAKLGALYLKKGSWNGNQIVDTSYVNQSLSPVNVADENGKKIDYYGYAWWFVKYKGIKVFYLRGIQGQYVFCVPEKNLIIVRLGEKKMKSTDDIAPDDVYLYLEEGLKFAK